MGSCRMVRSFYLIPILILGLISVTQSHEISKSVKTARVANRLQNMLKVAGKMCSTMDPSNYPLICTVLSEQQNEEPENDYLYQKRSATNSHDLTRLRNDYFYLPPELLFPKKYNAEVQNMQEIANKALPYELMGNSMG